MAQSHCTLIHVKHRAPVLRHIAAMSDQHPYAPKVRAATASDIKASLALGLADFRAAPLSGVWFSSVFVLTGLLITFITYATGHTFWLVLAVMGFPLVGTLAAVGFYEISKRRDTAEAVSFPDILARVWAHRRGQLPWLAAIIVVIFLFWFFLGHMIFALFLGLAPMTNVSNSLEVFLTPEGLTMLTVGTLVGAAFATLVFSVSVLGMPMIIDRDIDFVTAMLTSLKATLTRPALYLGWGLIVALATLLSMLPLFLGLFITMPVLGHTTWHLYRRLTASEG